ncbi:hypothetical protein [Photobacterium sp. Hal280]|uniref:hypothetical protein n=1 Tax=Photobacterium sp. Hal280 TaxID=3035163 RepID=UPI00301C434B
MKIGHFSKLPILLSLLWADTVLADDTISCPYTKVLEIQSQVTNVLIHLEGQGWKQLGTYQEYALNSRLSLALSAHASGKQIMLAFSSDSGVECDKTEYFTSPIKVRIR